MKIFTESTNTVGPTEAHFGARIAARLEEGSLDLPRSISERLRAGRMQALAKRRITEIQLAPALAGAQNTTGSKRAHSLMIEQPSR
jgi:hypothetical protein